MKYTSLPIILLVSYLIGEVFKILFKKNTKFYKLIPVIVTISGGLCSILIYYTNPEMLLNASNVWLALQIGLISGASATGTNQIIKQIFKK